MAVDIVVMIRDLSKLYRQGEINVTALNDLCLDIRMGEFLALEILIPLPRLCRAKPTVRY